MTKEERLQKQRERLTEMKRMEEALHLQGFQYVAGVDEVGRGPLAGPVVTAAVVLPEDFDVLGIDDSKKLSEKRREELYEIIIQKALAWGIGQADHTLIDEINILQATKHAMMQAIEAADAMLRERLDTEHDQPALEHDQSSSERSQSALEHDRPSLEHGRPSPEHDQSSSEHGQPAPELDAPGNIDFVLLDAVELPDLQIPQQPVIKGDAKVLAIAAASIVAKVTRDRMMVEYAKEYPHYAFERNKGYGTKDHYAGIREHGICPIHRKTFLKTIH